MKQVHFVGAGPGVVDLLTLRGKKLLEEADIIVYTGSLINHDLLAFAKAGCVCHNSAKMTLGEVVSVLIDGVAEGKKVVRLHTGDPSLYGAIREQIDLLEEAGIQCLVCPGVSSFAAAAAALKAEYTLPGVSQTVILTRAAGRTPVPDKESLRELAAHGSSLVLFLSASLLSFVVNDLLEAGLSPDTPAAIVYKASWPDEKQVRCTIETLESAAKANDITKTALVLIGGFLGDRYELSKLYDEDFTTEYREGKS